MRSLQAPIMILLCALGCGGDGGDDGNGGSTGAGGTTGADTKWTLTFEDGTAWSGAHVVDTQAAGYLMTWTGMNGDNTLSISITAKDAAKGDGPGTHVVRGLQVLEGTPAGELVVNCFAADTENTNNPVMVNFTSLSEDLVEGTVSIVDLPCEGPDGLTADGTFSF